MNWTWRTLMATREGGSPPPITLNKVPQLSLWSSFWNISACSEFSCRSLQSSVCHCIRWKFGNVAQWEELRHCRQSMGCYRFRRDWKRTDRKAHWLSHWESLAASAVNKEIEVDQLCEYHRRWVGSASWLFNNWADWSQFIYGTPTSNLVSGATYFMWHRSAYFT